MQTVVVNAHDVNGYATGLAQAASALRDGGLVIFPTETVYGVGANAADAQAVATLRKVKGRHSNHPFTVHVGQPRHARRFLTSPSAVVRRLVRKAWPGPLTLIAEEPTPEKTEIASICPPAQLAEIYENGTVGLRCPEHEAAARLLSEAGVPVVASSANRHGCPPPLDFDAALRAFDGVAAYAIDAGATRHRESSTIVNVRGNNWEIQRAGAMDERTIRRLARSEVLFVCTGNSCRSPMAEYLFRYRLAERLGCPLEALAEAGYRARSAGTHSYPGARASEGALGEMARREIDISDHRSQSLTVELVHSSERVYAMSAEHRQAILNLVPVAAGRVQMLDASGPVNDPIGGSAEQYRACADQIERAVNARLEEFLNEDRDW